MLSGHIPGRSGHRLWPWIGAAAIAVLIAGLVAISPRLTRPAPKPLTEQDRLVVADFLNTTGEPVFDGSLKVALVVALEQSPFLKVFPDARVRDTLRLRQFLDAPHQGQRNILVVNRVGEQGKGGIEIKDLSATIGMAIDVSIPFDPKSAVSAANAGLPVAGNRGKIAAGISQIAEELSGRRAAAAAKPWWGRFVK